MSRLTRNIVVTLSVLVFGWVAMGYVLGKTADDKTYKTLTVFSEVLEHIQHDYVEDPNMHQVTSGALHGLLDSLDPDSAYLSPLEYTDYKKKLESKEPAGSGLVLSRRYGYIVAITVIPESPAQKAGLRDGDILESIAGFTTSQMAVGQAEMLLRGQPGQVVKLAVIRRAKPEPQEMDVALAKVPAPKLLQERLPGDIGYLRIPDFDSGMSQQIKDKLTQMEKQGIRELILDLRDSAAGQASEAVSTAQMFLASGAIATLKGQTVTTQTFSADPGKVLWKQPVTVLISDSTAGPAEILAAAIGDNHRGETVGSRTFGAASEQKTIQLDDGSALILTVADYYTPANKAIITDGVEPTAEVRYSLEDLSQLSDQEETGPPPGQVASPDDPVVKKAIEILQSANARRKAA